MITPDPTACQYCGRVLPTAYSARIHELHDCQHPDAVAAREAKKAAA